MADIEYRKDDIDYWNMVETTDPGFTKQITGRNYRGTSPNVTYLIRKATEVYGLCGHGFGWTVVDEQYIQGAKYESGNTELLHVVRINFWTKHPETGEIGSFDSYGQTRMAYLTRNGQYIMDEDGPKKSLTDAITKAMSQLGFAADIFLGRYDDNKYVSELREQFGGSDSDPIRPNAPGGGNGAAHNTNDDHGF